MRRLSPLFPVFAHCVAFLPFPLPCVEHGCSVLLFRCVYSRLVWFVLGHALLTFFVSTFVWRVDYIFKYLFASAFWRFSAIFHHPYVIYS